MAAKIKQLAIKIKQLAIGKIRQLATKIQQLATKIRQLAIDKIRQLGAEIRQLAIKIRQLGAEIRLALAAAMFVGWLTWLAVAAINKSRDPTISRAQAALADTPIVVELTSLDNPGGTVKVHHALQPGGPPPGSEVRVVNLAAARGFDKPGLYLLLLQRIPNADTFLIPGQQRSPGYELTGEGKPAIYPWTPNVQGQAESIFK